MNLPGPDKLKPLFERLRAIFAGMDAAFDEAAAHYNFSCSGCPDNCCTQRFFHYTLIEYLYLAEGVKGLDEARRSEAFRRAREVTAKYAEELRDGRLLPLMCPLNFDGLCSVYAHRPMICRAHGLPHRFQRPDGECVEGGGCHRFGEGTAADVRIDRTGFYASLAEIERDIRVETGFSGRYRKTTAQMLMDMCQGSDDIREGESPRPE